MAGLVELSTSSYPTRTRRNIEESDGTVIFSLEHLLSGGTKLTWGHANKVGKPVLHIYDIRKEPISHPDSLRLEVQALTDFLRSKQDRSPERGRPSGIGEPGVYEWTLTMLRFFLIGRFLERDTRKQLARRYGGRASRVGKGRVGDPQLNFMGQPLF